jgi:hypothetical protein
MPFSCSMLLALQLHRYTPSQPRTAANDLDEFAWGRLRSIRKWIACTAGIVT